MKAPDLRDDLVADDGVVIGYPSGGERSRELVLSRLARLRSGTVLYQGARIGDNFETGHHVIIREDSTIGDGVSIWSNSIVDYGCVIGDRVKIHSNCYIAQFTEIEDEVFLAPGVVVANDLYPGRADSATFMSGPRLKFRAQIGANSTLLPYVTVGVQALVGAGSVVTRDIPDGMVAYGCPAVPVRAVDELGPISSRIEPVEEAARRFRRRTRGGDA
jgi:acetyltransferase-like isoleucine patch superfamily enzyme